MHPAESKFFRHSRVALAARPHEVDAVDCRSGIARRQDVVDPMAAGTVGDHLRSELRGQAMVAGEIGGGTPSLDAKFLGEPHAFMTARTGNARQVLRRHRGIWIPVSLDGMNAMAVGADWRQTNAA